MRKPAKPRVKGTARRETNAGFAAVIEAFAPNRHVTYGGKGFGSTALKVHGRIFAMLSSKGQFVVKLPEERVRVLVQSRQGRNFDPGRGRVMKEWMVVGLPESHWLPLARDACEFVRRDAARGSRSR